MSLSAYNGEDEIFGYDTWAEDPHSSYQRLPQIKNGKVTLNIDSKLSLYTGSGTFDTGSIVLFMYDQDNQKENPIAFLRPDKSITFNKANLVLSANNWKNLPPPKVVKVNLEIIESAKTEYTKGDMFDLVGLKAKVTLPDDADDDIKALFDGKDFIKELEGSSDKLSFTATVTESYYHLGFDPKTQPLPAGEITVEIQFVDISHDDIWLVGLASLPKFTVKESDDDEDVVPTGPTGSEK